MAAKGIFIMTYYHSKRTGELKGKELYNKICIIEEVLYVVSL